MLCFSDIIGQPRALRALRRSIATNRLAHAYLFSGPDGVGKRTTALALAAALNCTSRPGEGCPDCDACIKLAHGHHPDVVTIAPAGVFIKIEQVRALEPLLATPPHEGNYRIIVVVEADALHPSAANALLKSVEEPRSDTIFVLCSAAPQRVVPTMVSRCRHLRFTPLARDQLLAVVSRSELASETDTELLRWACAVSEGSPGRVRDILADEVAVAGRELAERIEQAAKQPAALDVFALAEGSQKTDRALLLRATEQLQLRLRDQLLLSAGIGRESLVFPDSSAASQQETAPPPDSARILRGLRAIQAARRALEGNANAVLTLENLAFALQEETSG